MEDNNSRLSLKEVHNVNVVGSGEQYVVLCHGFGLDQSVWKYLVLVPHLVDEYRVILYDNMGAGSTNPDYFDFERYSSMEGYAYDLIDILDHLGVTSCIYVGHSVSCMAAVIASIHRPTLFSKLVFLSAAPRYLNDVDYNGGFRLEELDQFLEAVKSNFKTWSSGFASYLVGGDLDSEMVQEFSRTLFNMRPDIAFSVAKTIFQSDIRSFLGMIKVPCHIVQSRNDFAVPVEVSDHLHRNLGGGSVVEIMDDAHGHLPQLYAPAVAIPVLLKHIRLNISTK